MSPHDIDRAWSSPNSGHRPPGSAIDHLVLHYTGMRSEEGARDWLCDPRSQVSSHYLVFEDGRVLQLVDESRRAWHAGRSFWRGVTDLNSRSIGIEIANAGHPAGLPDFTEAQVEAVAARDGVVRRRHRPATARRFQLRGRELLRLEDHLGALGERPDGSAFDPAAPRDATR